MARHVRVRRAPEVRQRLSQRRFDQLLSQAMKSTLEIAEEAGKNRIETSGTNKEWKSTWHGRSRSGEGRIDSGKMRDEFSSRFRLGDQKLGRVSGEFGWLEGTPYYAKFQELGFRHVLTHEQIEGMRALYHASEAAFAEAVRLVEDAIEEFVRG